MTRIALVGAGRVGAHTARHLLATDGVDDVLVYDDDTDRARDLVGEVGGGAVAIEGPWEVLFDRDVTGMAVAREDAVPVIAAAVERGIGSASAADDPEVVRRLLELDAAARAVDTVVVAGAGLAPGLSDVLARYAAEGCDRVDEVHVSRYGLGGPECARRRRRSWWGRVSELDGGAWVRPRAGTARRLVAFPEPIGPHDCRRAASAVPQLVARAVPHVRQATFREAGRRLDRFTGGLPGPARARSAERLAGLHVEVRARRGTRAEVLVYGTVDLMAPMVGAVLATATLAAAGQSPLKVDPGARGLGELGGAPVLADLGRRGVRAARFEPA